MRVMQSYAELAPGAQPSDCTTAPFGPAEETAYTTELATATVAEPVQGGSLSISLGGTSFSCSQWTVENGPGVLVSPRIVLDTASGDDAEILMISD